MKPPKIASVLKLPVNRNFYEIHSWKGEAGKRRLAPIAKQILTFIEKVMRRAGGVLFFVGYKIEARFQSSKVEVCYFSTTQTFWQEAYRICVPLELK